MDRLVLQMRDKWEVMHAVVNGTDYLHEHSEIYLPQEPREEEAPYKARVNRSVLTPFVLRLIGNAAGLVLRRPIRLEGGDAWWQEVFRNDVDGDGTSLEQFVKKRFEIALTYGHSNMMVDAPRIMAQTGADELSEIRPYFVPIDPWQVLGWRRESDSPGSPLTMFRYQEERKEHKGLFGEEYTTVARVIEPGRYAVYKDHDEVVDSGVFGLDNVPVLGIYTNREGLLCSSPPLADVARLNITHYQRFADLLHSLHVAAIGLLVLEDYDAEEGVTGLSYAIRMTAGSKAYWVECDSGSFVAQAEAINRLENQMSHLGVTKLLGQKFVAESADAKRIDQQQANSVLAVASLELENSLNEAFRLAGQYRGIEPPKVSIDKDFDFYRLLGQDVGVLGTLHQNGQLSDRAFLKVMRHGEWLPDDISLDDEEKAIAKLREEKERAMKEQMQFELESKRSQAPPAAGDRGTGSGGAGADG